MGEITRAQIEELCKQLEEHATDLDGRQMPDLEPAKGDPTAGTLRTASAIIRRLVAERGEAIAQSKRNWDDCGKMYDALGRALQIVCLSEELCDAVDAEADDIGTGKRNSLCILQEIGPLVMTVRGQVEEAINGWPRF